MSINLSVYLPSLCCDIYCKKKPPEVFYKKGVFKNFAKFTGKHLCESPVFNKVTGLRPVKKRLSHRCFPVNSA